MLLIDINSPFVNRAMFKEPIATIFDAHNASFFVNTTGTVAAVFSPALLNVALTITGTGLTVSSDNTSLTGGHVTGFDYLDQNVPGGSAEIRHLNLDATALQGLIDNATSVTQLQDELFDNRPQKIVGSSTNDVIQGGHKGDIIHGGYGDDAGIDNDTISGGGGNDTIYGGPDNDKLYGGSGDDKIHGETANDTIYGGRDNDTLYGETGADKIQGGTGNDAIYGGGDNDTIHGGADSDVLIGGDGADMIAGGAGKDFIKGGSGNDRIHGGGGADLIFGGGNNDIIHGGDGADVIHGGTGNDKIYGEAGSDVLYGGDGNDTIIGGDGDNTESGGPGDDAFVFNFASAGGGYPDEITDFGSGDKILIHHQSLVDVGISEVIPGTAYILYDNFFSQVNVDSVDYHLLHAVQSGDDVLITL